MALLPESGKTAYTLPAQGGASTGQMAEMYQQNKKLNRVVEVYADYDGDPTGGTSSRDAILSALAEVESLGGATLHLRRGIFTAGNPTDDYIIALPEVPICIAGDGVGLTSLKVANGTGNFRAFVGDPTDVAYIPWLRVQDLTIDLNDTNNTVTAAADLSGGMARAGLMAHHGGIVELQRVRFYDVASTWCGAFSSDFKVIRILDCITDEVGSDVIYDHSSFYAEATKIEFLRNYFNRGSKGPGGSRTALETHGGAIEVAGNLMRGYQFMGNICASVVDANNECRGRIHHNRGEGVGWMFELYPSDGVGSPDPGIIDLAIEENQAVLDFDTWHDDFAGAGVGGCGGIKLNTSSESGTSNVSIRRNKLQVNATDPVADATALDFNSSFVYWARTSDAAVDRNLRIEDNDASGMIAGGIFIVANILDGYTQRGNRFSNFGRSDAGAFDGICRYGSVVQGTGSTKQLIDCVVDDEGYSDEGATHLISGGIVIATFDQYVNLRPGVRNWLRVADGTQLVVLSGFDPTAAAGAGAGSGPPSPVALGTDAAGMVGMGTGTSAAAGILATVTFKCPFNAPPIVNVTGNQALAGLGVGVANVTKTAFDIVAAGTPTSSQAVWTYIAQYTVAGPV